MPIRSYKRVRVPGGCYFFTVNLAQRHENDVLVRHIGELRAAFRRTRADWPFAVEGIVIMPEHLHCIWRLPDGDADFSTRWALIKGRFSRALAHGEGVTPSRVRKQERGIWQRRYWEHAIRDERDYWAHMDYLHFNPVKHGHVAAVREWPYSSFHRWVRRGMYGLDWAGGDRDHG